MFQTIIVKFKYLSFLIFFAFAPAIYALTFQQAVESLASHISVETLNLQAKALSEEGRRKSSWGDPHFRLAAKNFPKDSLKDDRTPMTGIEFGISQKIALTNKYGKVLKAHQSLAKSTEEEAKKLKENLVRNLWNVLILKRKIQKELEILYENNTWIEKILKVSKKLYENGKVSQQAILDIQIRKTEIEADISNKKFELLKIGDDLNYFIASSDIDEATIPWHLLDKNFDSRVDHRENALKEKLQAKDFRLSASRLNYIPDITLSLGYTKRSNIDGNGDFVGASLSFPLPFSDDKYAKHSQAVNEKQMATKQLENYKREKTRDSSILAKEIAKYVEELKILNEKTIKFATNSRAITSKSYGLGNTSYLELLQSEFRLQKILMHRVMLEFKRDMKKIAFKYILGEPLYE